MNINAKVDWIGTPKPYIYKDDVTYDATAIDFSLEHDDNRYKFIVFKHDTSVQYKLVQYGIKPGSQKPFPIEIPFQAEMLPLIEKILQDPYVQAILGRKTDSRS
ncbi:DUF3910 family protein [Bacillus sp. DX1.1]|uniref:DUF3910 family protein n=1 Tax=unclassified Bacillus (in: firmicutes) TaxID=185979 RepID=UPI002570E8ED|nr:MULTISPECIES: DUF3910 family protein [unclassified Bacillus (in: firmicutes)]MDM5157307.1 DUF3910 family protein [Bacillus sp. DX1.1]WJE81534.1 DUF3910 family protein [Bacillus sp. DX3.1]